MPVQLFICVHMAAYGSLNSHCHALVRLYFYMLSYDLVMTLPLCLQSDTIMLIMELSSAISELH